MAPSTGNDRNHGKPPLLASDIAQISQDSGYQFGWHSLPSPDAPFLGGRFTVNAIAEGMSVHVTSGTELTDAVAEFTVQPSLSIFLLIEGYLAFEVDGETWELGADDGVNVACGIIWSRTTECQIRRHSRRGRSISKVAITLHPTWFETLSLAVPQPLADFRKRNLAQVQWCPTARALRNARDIVHPIEGSPLQARLGIHRRALQIVQEALGVFDEIDLPAETADISERAIAIRTYLDATLEEDLSLGRIGRDLGMSVSVLQDRFRDAFEMTVGEYRRRQRLIHAHIALRDQGVTVSEASTIAGYTNPANFATAFGKQFGYAPSRARG